MSKLPGWPCSSAWYLCGHSLRRLEPSHSGAPCQVRLVEALLGFVAGKIVVVVRFVSIPCFNAGSFFVANMLSETCKDSLSSHSLLPHRAAPPPPHHHHHQT